MIRFFFGEIMNLLGAEIEMAEGTLCFSRHGLLYRLKPNLNVMVEHYYSTPLLKTYSITNTVQR